MTDLRAYYLMLSHHNWRYHEIVDDEVAYHRASAYHLKLQNISTQSPEHLALYIAWERYGLTGDPNEFPSPPGHE